MAITEKQAGVRKGMMLGIAITIIIVALGALFNPLAFPDSMSDMERLSFAITCLLLPVVFLVVSVGRLAKHRFFTPEDIDGGGLSAGTERAMMLQSLLQNTLEQLCIALVVYLAWAIIMPPTTIAVIAFAAIAFAIGRILFFAGYAKGAPSRALGFTLSFYPSALMLVCIFGYLFWGQLN